MVARLSLWFVLAGVAVFVSPWDPGITTTVYLFATLALATWWIVGNAPFQNLSRVRSIAGPDAASLLLASLVFGISAVDTVTGDPAAHLVAVVSTVFGCALIGFLLVINQPAMLGAVRSNSEGQQMSKRAERILGIFAQPLIDRSYVAALYMAAASLLLLIPSDWPSFSFAAGLAIFTALMSLWDRLR